MADQDDTKKDDGASGTAAGATAAGATATGATASGAGAGTKDDTATPKDIVVDKNKSAGQYMKEAEVLYIVPKLVREKFPDLVKLIYETESMNKEEREYWLQIMPIMTEDQIVKFRDILVNEKEQLAKLDKEYENEMARINQKHSVQINAAEIKKKHEDLKKAETVAESEEKSKEDALLDQLENL